MSIAGELELNPRRQSQAGTSYSHQRVCASTFFTQLGGEKGLGDASCSKYAEGVG
jgi:hypothetical protein